MRRTIQDLVPYNPGKSVQQLEKEIGKKIIKLSANESLWGPSPAVLEVLRERLPEILIYPDGSARDLKEFLAEDWHLSRENFCLGNGADEIIFLLAAAFLDPGEEVLIPQPTFSEYAVAAKIAGAKVRIVNQPDLSFNLRELARQVSEATKMVFLCNPNNPTGTFFSHQELEEFLETIPGKPLVVLDEAYCQFATDRTFPRSGELLASYPKLVVMRTFSKLYGLAALRVGYAVAEESVIESLEKVRSPFNVNALGQAAALAALRDKEYTRKVIGETVSARTWLEGKLKGLGIRSLPSQANFLLIETKEAKRTAERLLQEGILVRSGDSFGLPDWIRVTIGPQPLLEKFILALEKIWRR